MNASEKFVAILDAAEAYLKLYEPKLTGTNLSELTNARHDARERLKNAVEAWEDA